MKKLSLLLVIALTSATLYARPLAGQPADSTHQYLFIVRYNTTTPRLSDDAMKSNIQHWGAWIGQLSQTGKLVTAYRPGNGGQTIAGTAKTAKDGPYTDDKAVISSIFIVRATNQEEAATIARTCPIYETDGSIEIRPITDTTH